MRQVISELEEREGKKDNKNKKRKLVNKDITLKTFNRQAEGFGIDWSPLQPGVLAAGGHDKKIEIYIPTDESCTDWILNSNNLNNSLGVLKGHKASIEDIIWSPSQAHVLASCSMDRSIRFWDLRTDKNSPPIVIEKAHDSDVNVISWNHFCDFMIASGGDDCAFKVWDIRYISNGPISNIQWHKGPITALSWDPYEDSQLAVSSEDNRVSIWDFAVEPDDTHLFDATNQEIPQQLIFLHQGQENIKDLKFHPQFKNFIVSTAENGINVFKPAFDDEGSVASDEDMYVDN
jgi:ribosome assembly protein RRB1